MKCQKMFKVVQISPKYLLKTVQISSKYRQNTVTPEDRIKLSSMLDNLYQLGVQSDSTSLRLMDLVGLSGTDVYLKAFEQQLEVED